MTAPRPAAVIVVGPAGSGKSTIAARLAAELGAAHLDKDRMVTPLTELLLAAHGVDPLQRESSPFYLEHVFPAEYEALLGVAGDSLRAGTPVVIDAPFFAHLGDPAYLERATGAAGWPAARVVVAAVTVSPEVARARIAARGLARDRWKLDHWEEYAALRGREIAWTGAEIVGLDADPAQPDLGPVHRALAVG